ncbi:unnamed protein product [Victoria cruziana]
MPYDFRNPALTNHVLAFFPNPTSDVALRLGSSLDQPFCECPFHSFQIFLFSRKQADNPMKKSSPQQSTVISAGQHHQRNLCYDSGDDGYVEYNRRHGHILSVLLKFVLAFSVFLCLGDLIGLFVLRPVMVELSFEKASVAKFTVTNENILNLELALDVRVRNPNKKFGVYYESLEAVAFYEGERLGSVPLPSFYQEPENTTYVRSVFSGQLAAGRGYAFFRDYVLGRHRDWFQVEVKFFTELWLKIGPLSAGRYEPELTCPLLVRLGSVTSSRNPELKLSRCEAEFHPLSFSSQVLNYIFPFMLVVLYLLVAVFVHFI